MGWLRRVNRLALGLVAASGVAAAHGVGGSRFEAPLPLALVYAGAGATVALTAVWLAVSSRGTGAPRSRRRLATVPESAAAVAMRLGRAGFLLAFLLSILAGLLGPQVAAENVATVFVWPLWFEGLAVVAALLGSPWRVLSPWRTIYAGLTRLEGGEVAVLGPYPERLGSWPALLGFVVLFGVVENLTVVPRSPALTAAVVALYAVGMVVGAVAFGEAWFDRADALAVLYRLFGRVAPVSVEPGPSGGYAVSVRYPWEGCTREVRDLAVAAFVVATVFTVSFDGVTSAPEFQTVLFALRDATGLGPGAAGLLYLVGFGGFLAAFAGVVAVSDVAGRRRDRRSGLLSAAPTLLPIAVAYAIAHNYPYVAENLGQLVLLVGRDLGAGPVAVDPLGWLSLSGFWVSQVLLVVAGHVVAVVAAHGAARRRYSSPRLAGRAHLPLTALMVGYTVLSLWIVSRPVVA